MNTTQQTTQAAPQQSAPASNVGTTFEQRLAAVNEEIRNEATSQAAADSADAAAPAPPDGSAPADSPAASEDAATKARAERKARLDALTAQERERVDARSKLAEKDRLARELEQERQTRTELEARTKDLIDIGKLDEASFFDLAKRANINPAKLGEWIREAIANPERLASHAAAQAIDPKLSALEARLAEQDKTIRSFMQERDQERAQREQYAQTEQFLGFVGQSAHAAPLAASMLERSGRDEFLKIANMVGQTIPAGAGPEAVLDAVEHFLDSDGRSYAQQLAEMYGLIQPTTSNGTSTPSPKSAAAKATTKTVSNALAQERASVVQEEEWAKLPYEERLARLKRSA